MAHSLGGPNAFSLYLLSLVLGLVTAGMLFLSVAATFFEDEGELAAAQQAVAADVLGPCRYDPWYSALVMRVWTTAVERRTPLNADPLYGERDFSRRESH